MSTVRRVRRVRRRSTPPVPVTLAVAAVLALVSLGATRPMPHRPGPVAEVSPAYLDPTDLVVTPDGATLAVACSGTDELLVLDLPDGTIRSRVPVGDHPSAVALAPDGVTAFVANRDDDTVSVVDLAGGRSLARIATGTSPQDVLVTPDGRTVLTANAVSRDISFIALTTGSAGSAPGSVTGREVKRLRGGERPRALALAPDGRTLAVANLLADPHLLDVAPAGQVTLVDLASGRITGRVELPGTNLLRGVAATPDGSFLVPMVRPKNMIPLIQVDGGWEMTNGVALLDPFDPAGSARSAGSAEGDEGPLELLLDTRGAHFADPTAVRISPDGRWAYVTSGGGDRLVVVDLEALKAVPATIPAGERRYLADRLDLAPRYVVAAIPTGADPWALTLSPDGSLAYVADRLDDAVTVIDTAGRRVVRTIDLGGPKTISQVRRGDRLFHHSAATFHGQFTCATCHPDGAHDGQVYDISPDGLGRNLVDVKTLHGVAGTAPFKWSGHNPDLITQCGPRAALFINRSMGFGQQGTEDVVAYMAQIPLEPNRDRVGPVIAQDPTGARQTLTPLQAWGRKIFERSVDKTGAPIPESNRCSFCHSGPRGTSNRAFDVGTRSAHDDKGIFDTPGLNNLVDTGPYLHDGKALTLEELWTTYNPDDRHGRANDLAKEDLNALIEYLKTF